MPKHNIIASDPKGPRGDPILSHELADDPENLMLMCGPHHSEIDDMNNLDRYKVDVLREMKRRHEERVARSLAHPEAPRAHILRVCAAIGDNETSIPARACTEAMVPHLVIADRDPIDISFRGMEHKDSDPEYYPRELENLRTIYDRQIRGRYRDNSLEHLAVFGFAPIPILMELGRLLSDLTEVTVFGRHREPRAGWAWPNDVPEVRFERLRGAAGPKSVALKLCVSAEISDDRIIDTLGEDISIWTVRSSVIDVHTLRNETDLSSFRKLVGRTLDEIKTIHGRDVRPSVFPAIPAACAIEFGRTWQPKAHPAFDIFDETPTGFLPRHRISS